MPQGGPEFKKKLGREFFQNSDFWSGSVNYFWNFYFSIFGLKIKSENSTLHEFLIQGGLGGAEHPPARYKVKGKVGTPQVTTSAARVQNYYKNVVKSISPHFYDLF